MTREFHSLIVSDVIPEIGGAATSVTLEVPESLREIFSWKAGQHLTLRFCLNGEEHRRRYTISNPPNSPLRITVKRVKWGEISNYIGDTVRPGDSVDVMPPFGGFALTPDRKARRTHYFFGAGSGITPLISMIRSMLAEEPHSKAHLIFGNSDAKSILYHDELDALLAEHPDCLTVRHVLSSPSMWSWFKPWRTGRVDAAAITAAIKETPPIAQDVQYWVCGPSGMNADVKTSLMALDVPESRIHMESFGGVSSLSANAPGTVSATARITLNGKVRDLSIAKGQTLLDAARKAGIDLPYSCQSGVCGACKARLEQGKVHMANRIALEDADITNGDILCCQSSPLTEQLVLKI